ncbi:hypothetical protein BFP72_16770 [Reichenbachiella sp. 5M10]|uniref:hypothetical protein n=1 Tax=Reichenbachiella sp. 5M10 TaxID=1889772 RepID=UPI000C1483D3|nr:hypothetical protein [Reichenbachiella sp. 5M10]PIB36938.1 hypothetical protein BFP72_16770 [Reichenbachiella sp. 5M10]
MENKYVPKIPYYKERVLGDRINVTFEFIRENFKHLFKTILIIDGPIVLLVGFSYAMYMQSLMGFAGGGAPEEVDPTNMLISSLGMMISGFFLFYSFFAIVLRYLALYQEMPPEEITTGLIARHIFKDGGKLFLISIPLFIMVFVSMFFLVVPMIYVSVAFSMVFTIVIFEKGNLFRSFGRSFKLIQGHWWSTFGYMIVLYFIQMAIAMVFYLPMYGFMFSEILANQANPDSLFTDMSNANMLMMSGTMAFAYLGILMSYTISVVAISFQYFNLREQKEAVGLMSNIEEMNQAS